jgi:predicted metalloprotease with PDZ domain
MTRNRVALALAFALGCGQSDRDEEAADTAESVVEERVPAGEAPAIRRHRDVIPEYRLRIDPSTHTVDGRIELDVASPDTIHLLFRAEWGGYPGLESRLRRLEAFGGGDLSVVRDAGYLGTGHHLVPVQQPERVTIAFTMVLDPPDGSLLYHRASQLDADGGHLIAGDVLPRVWLGPPQGGDVRAMLWFTGMPRAWRVTTVERREGTGYDVADVLTAVFVIGRLHTERLDLGPRSLTTAVYGRWPVDEERVVDAANRIAGNLHRIAGDGWASGDYILGAGRVPLAVPGLSTGGQVIARSGIVLVGGSGPPELEFERWMFTTAHELMHWYIPVGFSFQGDPPRWFYEGFTDYMALKSLLVGGLIEPQGFLDEIAARLDRYRSSPLYGKSSAEAEEDFWTDDAYRYVYDGGAVAGFLVDLGFQDRGGSLERAIREARRSRPLDQETLVATFASIRENEWFNDWVRSGANPDWDDRLGTYRLVRRNGSLESLDDWATNALSTIRP